MTSGTPGAAALSKQCPESVVPAPRDAVIDTARGIGMMLVIYGHILQIFFHRRADGIFLERAYDQWVAIYGFHMPMFFVLAGMASVWRPATISDAMRRAVSFVIIALVVDVVGLAAIALVNGASALPSLNDYAVDHVLRLEDFSIITPWFLVTMALVYIAAAVLETVPKPWPPVVAATVIGLSALAYAGPQSWHLRALAPGLAFYLLGRWLESEKIKLPLWLCVLLLLGALGSAHFNSGCSLPWETACDNSELPGRFCVLMIFGFVGNLPLFFITAVAGSVGCIGISQALAGMRLSVSVAAIGRRSLELFILNGFALVFANAVLRNHVPAIDSSVVLAVVGGLTIAAHLGVLAVTQPIFTSLRRATDAAAARLTRSVTGQA